MKVDKSSKSKVFLAYIPVLHQGYLQFFHRHPETKILYLIGSEFLNQYRSIQKDLRALTPEQMKTSIASLKLFEKVEILNSQELKIENLTVQPAPKEAGKKAGKLKIVSPDEEVSRDFIQKYFPDVPVEFDSIFLRWDRKRSLSHTEVEPDVRISQSDFDQQMMKFAYEASKKSSDWWRQTAAILVKDGKVVATARNAHVPQDYQHYVDGDPRADFQSGEHVDLSTSLHAEAAVLMEAARQGISTAGCWMYATTFPCPYCAPIVGAAGITKLYYSEGYSLIDGAAMLKAKGVEIVKVTEK